MNTYVLQKTCSTSNIQTIISSTVRAKKAVRKIFEDIKYPEDELEKLREFEALVAKENMPLPDNWTKIDHIKMMYAGKFDFKKCVKIMRQHAEWRMSPDRGIINPKAFKLLETGALYISGRDKQYRPIVILNVHKIDMKTTEPSDLVEALNFVLDTCIKFYFVPSKVENWIFIIETNGAGFLNFPFKIVKTVNDATSVNYTSRLDRLYIMNPSPLLGASWKMVNGLLDPETASKIFMLKKADFNKLLEPISPDQLEQRYGGNLPTPSPAWPPTNTLNQPPYTEELKKEIEITKAQAVETIKFANSEVNKYEESKLDTQEREKRNSLLSKEDKSVRSERNSPEIFIKAESSSPDEQKFAKAAKLGYTVEDDRNSPSLVEKPKNEKVPSMNDEKMQAMNDKKEVPGSSPIQGILRENIRRTSQQLDNGIVISPIDQGKQNGLNGIATGVDGYTIKVKQEEPYQNEEIEGRLQENGEAHNKKIKVKGSVTFAGVDGSDVHDTSRRNSQAIILEGKNSFKNEFCGFCRPKDSSKDDEKSNCNVF